MSRGSLPNGTNNNHAASFNFRIRRSSRGRPRATGNSPTTRRRTPGAKTREGSPPARSCASCCGWRYGGAVAAENVWREDTPRLSTDEKLRYLLRVAMRVGLDGGAENVFAAAWHAKGRVGMVGAGCKYSKTRKGSRRSGPVLSTSPSARLRSSALGFRRLLASSLAAAYWASVSRAHVRPLGVVLDAPTLEDRTRLDQDAKIPAG